MERLARAIIVAAEAHAAQKDRADEPYVLHPMRVLLRVQGDEERQVAALHDVVERTDWTLERLRNEGFPARVVAAVDALSRREGEDYFDFVRRAISNPLARPVKRADLLDNLQAARNEPPSPKRDERSARYEQALKLVDGDRASAQAEPSPGVAAARLPAPLGWRLAALARLGSARRAYRRVRRGDDPETLHDFRVALRRLRALLRGCEEEVGDTIGRGSRRRLRAIGRATNARRDADVLREWLERLAPEPRSSAARAWLRERVDDAAGANDADVRRVLADFPALAKRLRRRIARVRLRRRALQAAPPLATVLAAAGRDLHRRLRAALSVRPPLPDEGLHAARILAKRLRYTLEAIDHVLPEALAPLVALQDLLGTARDLGRLLAAASASAPPAACAEEVARIRAHIEGERERAMAALASDWLGRRARAALRPVEAPLHAPARAVDGGDGQGA
jgi:CHAD domain-containing protein